MTEREYYHKGQLVMFVTEENRVFLVRCYKCGVENHTACVASGECAWCGWVGNEEEIKRGLYEEKKRKG